MTIYFDTCALNRLTDDVSQSRIREEADAVLSILELVATAEVTWTTSELLRTELSRNPDPIKRAQTLPLLDMASAHVEATPEMGRRARALTKEGFGPFDALHLAICGESSIDSMITVDDRLIRKAARRSNPSVPEVLNPVDWLQRRSVWQAKR
jgi:predicted nucleic acid-binding protein